MRKPRLLLFSALVLAIPAGILAARSLVEADLPAVTVYKSPTCGCCSKWVTHLEENGFDVKALDMPDVDPMKTRLGVPGALSSCHTAVVGGYVVEGHVPADVVKQLLQERPDVAGLAVPDMPIGSPGMEGPDPEPYDIIAFSKDGRQYVYASR